MATHRITMKDGTVYNVTARPGADDADIAAEVAAQHQASAPRTSGLPAAALGALKMADNANLAVSHIPYLGPAIDKAFGAFGVPTAAQTAASNDRLRANANGFMRGAGEVGAALAVPGGAGGLMARAGGNALTGALLSDKDTASGVAGDALASSAFGEVGRGLIKGVGKVVSPIVRDSVKTLIDRGIRLTPGQISGGWAQRLEDGVQGSVLGVGDMVAGARKRGLGDFVRATANDVLAPLGVSLPDHIPTGKKSVAYVKETLSRAYDGTLAAMHVEADPALQQAVGNITQNAANGPVDVSGQVRRIFDTKVKPYFAGGVMSGEHLKMIDRDLRETVRPYLNSAIGSEQAYAGHIEDLRQALKDAASRASGPDAVRALQQVDKAYAHYVPLRDAAAKTPDGIFSPSNLGASVKKSDRSAGKGNTATGTANLSPISDAAREILPSTVPDSGTARRLMIQSLFTGGAGGLGLMAGAAHPASLALGGLAAGAYTPKGQQLMTGLLTGRQGASAVAARGLLDRAAPYAGRFAASGVPALLLRNQ